MNKRKKLIFFIISVLVLVAGYVYYYVINDVEITKGSQLMTKNYEWNNIIADIFNKSQPVFEIDGKQISLDSDDLYMSNSMNPMISSEKIKNIFSCAVNAYDKENLIVEKANVKLVLNVNRPGIVLNGNYQDSGETIVAGNNRFYVPLSIFEDYFSYDYNWNFKENKIQLINLKPNEKIYPHFYDYRTDGRIVRVKDQKDLGTCWAFASLTALETSLMNKYTYDFSEDHMSCHNGYNLKQTEGGDYNMSMAYLSSWTGPVLEEEDPYGDGISPDGLSGAVHVQEMQIIESKDLDGIKRAVFLYGGVQSSLYMSMSDSYGNDSEAYNSQNSSYCYIGNEKANHDVVIVGWDDHYEASNFSTVPEGDGAFICVNSWGKKFGDAGYFYVSYYDSGIGMHNLVYTGIEPVNNYDKIYQSDKCGWVGQLGYNREYAYFSNVYTAQSDEILSAVGFYATDSATSYDIYVVENYVDESSFDEKRKVVSGSFANAGYYTVKIPEEIIIPAGKSFAVIVYINTPSSVKPIAIEFRGDYSTSTVDITDGNGYISLNGMRWEHVEATQQCNVCLKAYTVNTKDLKG